MLNRIRRMVRQTLRPPQPSAPVSTPPVEEPQPPTPAFAAALTELGPGALTVLDVGARWGAKDSWFRLKPLARLVGFEPDPVECRRLNELAEPGQESFYPVALWGRPGTQTLHVTKDPACSSLYPPGKFALERFPSVRPLMTPERTTTIPVTTLRNWAGETKCERVDFIKLDTQGAELEILQGAGPLLDRCLGIEAEVMFTALYEGQPLFADVDSFLRSRGFTLWRLDCLVHHAEHPTDRLGNVMASVVYEYGGIKHPTGDGRLAWANAIYFRDRVQVRESIRSLLALAALLEAVGDRDGSRCCLDAAGRRYPLQAA